MVSGRRVIHRYTRTRQPLRAPELIRICRPMDVPIPGAGSAPRHLLLHVRRLTIIRIGEVGPRGRLHEAAATTAGQVPTHVPADTIRVAATTVVQIPEGLLIRLQLPSNGAAAAMAAEVHLPGARAPAAMADPEGGINGQLTKTICCL